MCDNAYMVRNTERDLVMEYHYQALETFLQNISTDMSYENVAEEAEALTSDEKRKMINIIDVLGE